VAGTVLATNLPVASNWSGVAAVSASGPSVRLCTAQTCAPRLCLGRIAVNPNLSARAGARRHESRLARDCTLSH